MKTCMNSNIEPPLYFWRDSHGHEIDLIIENGEVLFPIEIKSGQTINGGMFDGLSYWRTLSSQAGTVYTAGKLHKMKREISSLQRTNEIIRQCRCTASATNEEKVEEVKRLKEQFPVRSICRVLNLSHTTFYRITLEQKRKTLYEIIDDSLRAAIETEFYDSGERFGAAMIRVKLNERGYTVSKKHIQRLMHEMNLVCKQNKPRVFNSTHRKYKYRRNRLQRNFTQDAPNKFWVSDITYARVNDEFYGVCVVIDLFSRRVLSYGISPEMKMDLVKKNFSEGI